MVDKDGNRVPWSFDGHRPQPVRMDQTSVVTVGHGAVLPDPLALLAAAGPGLAGGRVAVLGRNSAGDARLALLALAPGRSGDAVLGAQLAHGGQGLGTLDGAFGSIFFSSSARWASSSWYVLIGGLRWWLIGSAAFGVVRALALEGWAGAYGRRGSRGQALQQGQRESRAGLGG
jgi:hypothetical protein